MNNKVPQKKERKETSYLSMYAELEVVERVEFSVVCVEVGRATARRPISSLWYIPTRCIAFDKSHLRGCIR